MAEAEANNGSLPNPPARIDWREELTKFRQPGPLQIGILAGVVALLALLIALTLWYTAPTYDVLYRGLAQEDAGQIMEALQKANIPFKIDSRNGALMVNADQVHEARLKLAGQGLPKGTVNGLEALEKQDSFGVSQFMETTRYQHALEGELARSVMTIGAVESARVHLAFPRETVFARQQQPPTASILVRLRPGRVLDEGQVAAIIHLIASSVPKLKPEQVSVVDQYGNLLTRNGRDGANGGLNMDQLNYSRQIEERYARRVEDLLTPVWGPGRVRAQVSLDLDFNTSEETAERYEPREEPRPVRSEQLLEENNPRQNPVGIPGALSNQPPGAAVAPEVAAPQNPANPQNPGAAQTASTPPLPTRKEVTRNYELDKRVTQVRSGPGRVLRVSAAVVIDDRITFQEGKPVRTPVTPEEMERITNLVKQAVGFSAERGDSVNVFSATFAPSSLAALDELNAVLDEMPVPMWQQAWFLELVKWGVVAVMSLLFLWMVVRPVMRRLLPPPVVATPALEGGQTGQTALLGAGGEDSGLEGLLEDQVQIGGALQNGRPKDAASGAGSPVELLEERMELARTLVAEDPKRAVQVIRNWLTIEA
ncbi:MAG: flagellar M-ring protein FliF [Pseudomonadota bacterium]|nr:flagellar M-ring protein FliF [Pseudomonadota bacterium]